MGYQYVSDALGYRLISGTNLPVAPTAVAVVGTPVVNLVAPEPVQETPEVAEARKAFNILYKKAVDAATVANSAAAPVDASVTPVDSTTAQIIVVPRINLYVSK